MVRLIEISAVSPRLLREEEHQWYEVGDGWKCICRAAFRAIADVYAEHGIPMDDFEILQVKEKWGILNIYLGGIPGEIADKVFHIVDMAAMVSTHTCEICGLPGKRDAVVGWTKTLCDKHFEELDKDKGN